jgi:hypothetical protein
VTSSEFLALYPEFATCGDVAITAVIAEQELTTSDTWGTQRDAVLALSVASRLSDSIAGRNARVAKAPRNLYEEKLDRIRLGHACCFMRIG